jgi:hypothetical protein
VDEYTLTDLCSHWPLISIEGLGWHGRISNTNWRSSEGYNLIRSGAPTAHDVSRVQWGTGGEASYHIILECILSVLFTTFERKDYPERWPEQISDEAYEVLYRAERRIKPWDRREIGMRRAQVGRLLRGPRGAMALWLDIEEGPTHVEIDPLQPALDIEELGPF